MVTDEQVGPPVRDSLIARIRRSWARDSHLSMKRRLQKGVQMVSQLARARLALRHCDRVGSNARVAGRMRVENRGSIVIGSHLNINSSWVPTELLTGDSGRIEIGGDVLINFGVVIAAGHSVSIGTGSMIGPHCIISDVDSPETVARGGSDVARPIEIGRDVWLAGRVTVRPGVRIGDGAVVVAGSIVETDVPPNVMASGIPARLLPKLGAGSRAGAPVPQAGTALQPPAGNSDATRLRGVVISNHPLDDFAAALHRDAASPALDVTLTPAGEHANATGAAPPAGAEEFVVIWVDAAAALPSYALLLAGKAAGDSDLERDTVAYCQRIAVAAGRYRHVFVPTWSPSQSVHGAAPADYHVGGVRRALMLVNWTLVQRLGGIANVHILDGSGWHSAPATPSAAPHAWYLAGLAVPPAVQERAAVEIRAALAALRRPRRTLLILVAHDTLWVARAGGPMASAERRAAYADFQSGLVALRARGIRLAVVGTGDADEMRAALREHPDLVLTDQDIAAWCVGGQDITEQVTTVARELGLSTHDVVVIDTHAAVRGRLAEALPEAGLPEWPDDVLLYPMALAAVAAEAALTARGVAA